PVAADDDSRTPPGCGVVRMATRAGLRPPTRSRAPCGHRRRVTGVAADDTRSEPELTGPVPLCTPAGRLNRAAVGWSRRPVHDCTLPGSWGRRKRWDFWCV